MQSREDITKNELQEVESDQESTVFFTGDYPFGTDTTVSLLCQARASASEEPQVELHSDKPVTVEIYWNEGRQSKTLVIGG
ncbi:MAG: hypothetical protein IJT41_11695 [Clostridia bacterium]|nr:hypothetical protein [Clostridia bacterium]